MIKINDHGKELINKIKESSYYVVADFDRTITVGSSDTSWSILSKSDLVPKEYALERSQLYENIDQLN